MLKAGITKWSSEESDKTKWTPWIWCTWKNGNPKIYIIY